jgi:hypothetical protein
MKAKKFNRLQSSLPTAGRSHSRGAAVGQQIDQHIIRVDIKKIVSGFFKNDFAFFAGGKAQGLSVYQEQNLQDIVSNK